MESRATATASLPGIARCAWRELDVSAVIGMRLHPAYRPCDWDSHQYANEVWLDRALQAQPSGDGTSVVYLANHGLSLWCYREITSRRLGLRDITSLTSSRQLIGSQAAPAPRARVKWPVHGIGVPCVRTYSRWSWHLQMICAQKSWTSS